MLKILWINPVGTGDYDDHMRKMIESVKRSDVEVRVAHLSKGPRHLEYHFYEHLVMEETLQVIRDAEKDGLDAAVIGCFYDPGLREARELVRMPVIAPAEACMHIASTLGHKFSIIVGRRKWIPKMEDNVYMYGLEKKLASFRVINFTVPQMGDEPEKLQKAVAREATAAVKEDGAEVIVLGCTMESGFMRKLMRKLKVPVLDAVIVTWKYAEVMADLYRGLGLTHSKAFGYESPPESEGWVK